MPPSLLVTVALGSALGGAARVWLSTELHRLLGPAFPWGTLTVNVVGSAIIGFATGLSLEGYSLTNPQARAFVMAGFCGGFTTFSTFSLETVTLFRQGDPLRAGLNVLASLALCLVVTAAGYALALNLRSPLNHQ